MNNRRALRAAALAAACVCLAAGLAQPAGAVPPRSYLFEGESLAPGQYLTDSSGLKLLTLQAGGDLVLTDNQGATLWRSGTGGHPGARLVNQLDGDLVVASASGQRLWSINTNGRLHNALIVNGSGVYLAAPNHEFTRVIYTTPPPAGCPPVCLPPPAATVGMENQATPGTSSRFEYSWQKRRLELNPVHVRDTMRDGACATVVIVVRYRGFASPPRKVLSRCDASTPMNAKLTWNAPARATSISQVTVTLTRVKNGKVVNTISTSLSNPYG